MNVNRKTRGFTLIELLVVIAVIAGFTAVLLGALRENKAAALQSAQATMANLVTAARTRAMASGKRTRLLVHVDLSATAVAGRFLRTVLVQSARQTGSNPADWQTISITRLPGKSYVLPPRPSDFPELIDATGQDWRRPAAQSKALGSSLFAGSFVSIDLQDGYPAEQMQGVVFTERGTIARLDGGGAISDTQIELVVGTGETRGGAERAVNESPVRLDGPDAIRGLSVSSYGVPTLINQRESF